MNGSRPVVPSDGRQTRGPILLSVPAEMKGFPQPAFSDCPVLIDKFSDIGSSSATVRIYTLRKTHLDGMSSTKSGGNVKLGIVGVGAVGAATALAVVLRAQVRELVLVDKNRSRARAVATDMTYGVPLSPVVALKEGGYEDLADAGVVVITAGINERQAAPSIATIPPDVFGCWMPTLRYTRISFRNWLKRHLRR